MSEKRSKRFLSIRLSPEELDEIYRHQQQSTCRSLTGYVKKVLTGKPVTVKVRDQSRDEILQQLVDIKKQLDTLAERHDRYADDLLNEIKEVKSYIRQIAEKC